MNSESTLLRSLDPHIFDDHGAAASFGEGATLSRADLLAAAPAFLTDYPLETTLAGPARRVVDGLRRVAPDVLTLRLAKLAPVDKAVTLSIE